MSSTERPQATGPARDEKIRAVILAAGRGSRLGKAAREVPKCLIEIGRRCLVEHQLDALAEAGVGPTTLVVGYAAEEVRELVGIRAEFVTNTRWSQTNSLYSLWLAREHLQGTTVILNSDVLFSHHLLERLLEVEGDAIAIDSSSGQGREQMKVEVHAGRVTDMRKDLPAERSAGENVGMLKLTAETLEDLLDEAQRQIEAGREKSWLGSAISVVAKRRPISVVDAADLPWVEIDFPTDLVRARKEVWPLLRKSGGRGRLWLRRLGLLAALIVLSTVPFGVRMLMPPPPQPTWSTIELDSTQHDHVLLGGVRQSWWFLAAGQVATVYVRGPGPVRVDTRLLDPQEGRSDYVLEVEVDGERLGWFTESPRPSGTYTHPDWVIGRRKRVEVTLEEGLHEIRTRLLLPEAARCLIRIRRQEAASED